MSYITRIVIIMEKENNNIILVNNESDVEKYETDNIKNLIYTIRGKQVMLDSDVAMLYHYETKNINKAMKRNIERFPEDFCFQLTEKEVENLRFQFGTSSLELCLNFNPRLIPFKPHIYLAQICHKLRPSHWLSKKDTRIYA